MFKTLVQKGNAHKSDYLRTLLSDTMPSDIPIIVSNDGLYKNLKHDHNNTPSFNELVGRILSPERGYTIPYRYNILRAGGLSRRLSLVHPSAQLEVAKFYRDAGNLICYYARRSIASLRAPDKVGSLFFVRGPISDKNRLKSADVDTVSVEDAVSNPASYFSYRGFNRAYKFFNSPEYIRLEKRFSVCNLTDVSKCFSSIYTHTLYWAIVNVRSGKDNTRATTFSNRFDRLMQSMNFNETNGICVGAEVSRIFAEIILGEVDRRSINRMSSELKFGRDYEFYRYVDDYYIFATNTDVAKKMVASISVSLSEFNLHLNEAKTTAHERPFITTKSRVIREANANLNSFFKRFLREGKFEQANFLYPRRVWRSGALLRSFLDSVKAGCFDLATGYEGSSDYVISALASRVGTLTESYELARKADEKTPNVEKKADPENYLYALLILLEAAYFFYSVNPTVSSSHKLGNAAILAVRFVGKVIPDRLPMLNEQIVRWTSQILKSLLSQRAHEERECVPLEILNVLLVVGEMDVREDAVSRLIHDCCEGIENAGYFEVVTMLYCIGDRAEFGDLRNRLFSRARDLTMLGKNARVDSEAAHVALDILACPYLDRAERVTFFNDVRKAVGLASVTNAQGTLAVEKAEESPWFVNWKEPDILRLIRKKELSEVY
jgi:Reverse transcriptase (RNA-dependent DNA polymerase)